MIFQVYTGRWQRANSIDHSGKVFLQLIKEYDWGLLKSYGIDSVYLLGVFNTTNNFYVSNEEGENLFNKKNRTNSAFAIIDHRHIDPRLGTKEQFGTFLSHLQSLGLKVIIDYVPNHRSWNHSWRSTHPDFFVTKEGEFVREFSGDVIKLDYQNKSVVTQQLKTLTYLRELKVNGIRCDMAHLIPDSFWKDALSHLISKTSLVGTIAEVYPDDPIDTSIYQKYLSLGFGYVYHGILYKKCLDAVLQTNASDLVTHMQYILNQPWSNGLLNYFANHDDFSAEFSDKSNALLLLFLGLPGEFLLYNGALLGRKKRLAHHWVDILPDYENELVSMPESCIKIAQIFKKHNLIWSSIEHVNDGLIKVTDLRQKISTYLNIGKSSQKISINTQILFVSHSMPIDTIPRGEGIITRCSS